MLYNIIPLITLPLAQPSSFTYEYDGVLAVGQVVKINFAGRKIFGVVEKEEKEQPIYKINPAPSHNASSLTAEIPLIPINLNNKRWGIGGRCGIKKIDEVVDDIVLNEKLLDFASWANEQFFYSTGLFLKMLILPNFKKVKTSILLAKKQKRMMAAEPILIVGNSEKSAEMIGKNIKEAFAGGEQILLLVPRESDIAKTKSFYASKIGAKNIFTLSGGDGVSSLKKVWQTVYSQNPCLVIGTRQALWLPWQNLGLVIVQDEHDVSHKQWDSVPFYNAADAACKLAEIFQARFIAASPAPRVETFYKYQKNVIWEKNRADININIVDMTVEHRAGHKSILSERIQNELEKDGQMVLFINRKGIATYVVCKDCGRAAVCPHCSLPLTQYDNNNLTCHRCGYKQKIALTCPHCHGQSIRYAGGGTEKVAEELRKYFPDIKFGVIDQNTSDQDKVYKSFQDNKIKVLIATSRLNLNLIPPLSAAAILSIDTQLAIPDFRASENAFRQIKILAEKIKTDGTLIIQTMKSQNPNLQSIFSLDDKKFYGDELKNRQDLLYPPFCRFIRIFYSHASKDVARNETLRLYNEIKAKKQMGLKIMPPAQSQSLKRKNKFVYQIIIKQEDNKLNLLTLFKSFNVKDLKIDADPDSLI